MSLRCKIITCFSICDLWSKGPPCRWVKGVMLYLRTLTGFFQSECEISMDIFVLKAFVDELARCLPGSRVSKVFQLSPDDLLLRLWRHRDQRLLLSIHPTGQRLHLVTHRFEAPPRPPRFAALLRARLRRARLQSVAVQPYERMVTFAWQQAGESAPSLRLIHELQGSQANLLLVDAEGMIVDALKHVPASSSQNRPLLPGHPYAPRTVPPQRVLLSDLTVDHLDRLQAQEAWNAASLNRLVVGLSPQLAAELVHRYPNDTRACWEQLNTLRQDYDNQTLPLYRCTAPDGQQHVSVLPLEHAGYRAAPLAGAQAAMAAISQPALVSTALDEARTGVRKTLRRRLQKLGRKVEHLNRDREKLKSYEPYQRYGTLLLTQRLPRGSTCATVTDYYNPEQEAIRIPLDPRLSINENAQAYFKKYRKTKTGLSKIETLLQECAAEERYLEGLAHQVSVAEDWPTLEEIEAELGGNRRAGPARPSIRPRAVAAQPYRTFALSGGYTLYCGKSNHANDALVRQVAAPDDLWFHAHGHAGAHVVLKMPSGAAVPDEALRAAAAVAAYYSKGKDATAVEVVYTAVKHVRKFRGARPGQVQVNNVRTLEVAPALPTTPELSRLEEVPS